MIGHTPHALHADFWRRPPQPRMGVGLATLGIAALIAASIHWQQQQVKRQQAEHRRHEIAQQQLAADERRGRDAARRWAHAADPRWQLASAELARPWVLILSAVELATRPPVRLTGWRTDGESGTWVLNGEAPTYEAVLGYLASLGAQTALREPTLVSHETGHDATGQIAVKFTIQGRWTAPGATPHSSTLKPTSAAEMSLGGRLGGPS